MASPVPEPPLCCRNGRITKIQGFLNSSASGLLVTYGNLVQRYGDWRDVPSTGALDISATITRVGPINSVQGSI
jgi:hypothetical protein